MIGQIELTLSNPVVGLGIPGQGRRLLFEFEKEMEEEKTDCYQHCL